MTFGGVPPQLINHGLLIPGLHYKCFSKIRKVGPWNSCGSHHCIRSWPRICCWGPGKDWQRFNWDAKALLLKMLQYRWIDRCRDRDRDRCRDRNRHRYGYRIDNRYNHRYTLIFGYDGIESISMRPIKSLPNIVGKNPSSDRSRNSNFSFHIVPWPDANSWELPGRCLNPSGNLFSHTSCLMYLPAWKFCHIWISDFW